MRASLFAIGTLVAPCTLAFGCAPEATDVPASGAGASGMSAAGSSGAGTGGSSGGVAGTGGSGGAGGAGGSGGSSAGKSGSGGASGGSAGMSGSGGALGGSAGCGGTGGSAGDAGTGGAGAGAGAGGTAGAATDPCDTAIFCDDFEGYTVGSAPGGMWNIRGTVAVDSAQKVSGDQAVKVSTNAGSDGTAYLVMMDDAVLPVPGNAFFGRMMFFLESAPAAAVHWTIIQGGGVVPNATHHAYYRYGGQHPVLDMGSFRGSQLMANYETPDWYSNMSTPGSDCWQHAAGDVLPTGRFTCVEWQFDGPNDTMRFWLDGAAIDSLTVLGSGDGCVNAPADFAWSAPEFDTLELGWEYYQQDEARTAWIDDVVISSERVGCP